MIRNSTLFPTVEAAEPQSQRRLRRSTAKAVAAPNYATMANNLGQRHREALAAEALDQRRALHVDVYDRAEENPPAMCERHLRIASRAWSSKQGW